MNNAKTKGPAVIFLFIYGFCWNRFIAKMNKAKTKALAVIYIFVDFMELAQRKRESSGFPRQILF